MGKKKFGDRYDGRRIRKGDPFNIITPYLMKTRNDSQVLFDAEIDVSKIDNIIKERRKDGDDISFLDYFLTALVRTVSQYPRLNRFIAGRRLYARNDLEISMVVKKELNIDVNETCIKLKFDKNDTVDDVSKKLRELVNENKGKEADENSTEKFVNVLNRLPRGLFSFVIWCIETMDYNGHLPKKLHALSPFHTSIFVTNMGSIGAEPIYHHIYNFGTTSIFVAMGNRRKQRVIDKDGKISERKVMKLRFVADERIGDGYYLSVALKYFNSLFSKPEQLETQPEKVVEDDQV